jgi:hypothetical protein
MKLVEGAMGDPGNALYLARASQLAYLPADAGTKAFREELGLEGQLFSAGNTQAYVGVDKENIVVAFRGTETPNTFEGLKDWLLTDAANLLIVPEGRLGTDLAAAGVGAKFHQGFVNALADIWEPVFSAVQVERKKQDRPLWITGHSLGGALALLAAWLFQRKFISVEQVYTFGGPMIGNPDASAALDRELSGKIFRYVNRLDPVPLLPTFSLLSNAYGHCNKEMGLGEVAAGAASVFQSLVGKTVDGVLNATLIDGIWKLLCERVDAHSMDLYQTLIGKKPGDG